jgi:tRNA (adenine22-N1)-methyltransferase
MNRLDALTSMVPKGAIVADIGTDHGYLPKRLVLEGVSPKVYAIDNKPGPLASAYENTKGIPGIVLSLADGIQQLSDDVTTLVLAGLGGRTIVDIVATLPDHVQTIITSPTVAVPLVRYHLVERGFIIDQELIVIESGVYYEILRFVRGSAAYQLIDFEVGPFIKADSSPIGISYRLHKEQELKTLLASIPEHVAKHQEIKALIQLYQT